MKQASGEKEYQRGEWKYQGEFLIATIGYTVGVGNLWRFSYYFYRNEAGTLIFKKFN